MSRWADSRNRARIVADSEMRRGTRGRGGRENAMMTGDKTWTPANDARRHENGRGDDKDEVVSLISRQSIDTLSEPLMLSSHAKRR